MRHRFWLLPIIVLMLTLTACSTTPTPPLPTRPGVFTIERVDLLILESQPPRVQAHIIGHLGDGCTSLSEITQQREGSTITITISTTHSGADICTAIAPLVDQQVMLEGPFTPGQYTVIVNGVTYKLVI